MKAVSIHVPHFWTEIWLPFRCSATGSSSCRGLGTCICHCSIRPRATGIAAISVRARCSCSRTSSGPATSSAPPPSVSRLSPPRWFGPPTGLRPSSVHTATFLCYARVSVNVLLSILTRERARPCIYPCAHAGSRQNTVEPYLSISKEKSEVEVYSAAERRACHQIAVGASDWRCACTPPIRSSDLCCCLLTGWAGRRGWGKN